MHARVHLQSNAVLLNLYVAPCLSVCLGAVEWPWNWVWFLIVGMAKHCRQAFSRTGTVSLRIVDRHIRILKVMFSLVVYIEAQQSGLGTRVKFLGKVHDLFQNMGIRRLLTHGISQSRKSALLGIDNTYIHIYIYICLYICVYIYIYIYMGDVTF